jgi:AAA+ superfamily predicted ATPase
LFNIVNLSSLWNKRKSKANKSLLFTSIILYLPDSEQEKMILRKSLKEYLVVREEEFNSVSSLVRGRAKLDCINKVLKDTSSTSLFKGNRAQH